MVEHKTQDNPTLFVGEIGEKKNRFFSDLKTRLLKLDKKCSFIIKKQSISIIDPICPDGWEERSGHSSSIFTIPVYTAGHLGDPGFKKQYGVKLAYMAGSMAHGISSVDLVMRLGRAGILASLGTGGLSLDEIETAIKKLNAEKIPYAVNLLHTPFNKELEMQTVSLYLNQDVCVIEASAFMEITLALVLFRISGLKRTENGDVQIKHKIIAKISRRETAEKFLAPPPPELSSILLERGLITLDEWKLAEDIPMADDLTVEADSAGHTDNRPLTCIYPSILSLKNEYRQKYKYISTVRIGVGGGIGTPQSALAAFMMGAAYIVTGSINQACKEAGTSDKVKELLSRSSYADVMMAPSSDMFELGIRVQLLKRGSMFPMRAQKLYDMYLKYNSLSEIPVQEKNRLEKQIFKKSLSDVWRETFDFFKERDPLTLKMAQNDEKKKMALVFRWYLGLSTRWAIQGVKERELDYQIWNGPSMGAFNDWARGSCLENYKNRSVRDIAQYIMNGAAYLYRIHLLKSIGIDITDFINEFKPGDG